jgi:hypothetical protein
MLGEHVLFIAFLSLHLTSRALCEIEIVTLTPDVEPSTSVSQHFGVMLPI